MTRVLAVNPNTSTHVTDAFVAAVRRIAPPEVHIDGVTGRFGADVVSSEAENLIAGHAMLELIAEHAPGYDAVILAISFDTGLLAARELLDVPVTGVTEAALRAAGPGRIGVVVFGAVSLPLYRRVIAGYGVAPVAFEAVETGHLGGYAATAQSDDAVVAAATRLARAGADAVVICGTVIVGMAERIASRLAVPVHDGAAALPLCLGRIGGPAPPKPVPMGRVRNVSDALATLISGGR